MDSQGTAIPVVEIELTSQCLLNTCAMYPSPSVIVIGC